MCRYVYQDSGRLTSGATFLPESSLYRLLSSCVRPTYSSLKTQRRGKCIDSPFVDPHLPLYCLGSPDETTQSYPSREHWDGARPRPVRRGKRWDRTGWNRTGQDRASTPRDGTRRITSLIFDSCLGSVLPRHLTARDPMPSPDRIPSHALKRRRDRIEKPSLLRCRPVGVPWGHTNPFGTIG